MYRIFSIDHRICIVIYDQWRRVIIAGGGGAGGVKPPPPQIKIR